MWSGRACDGRESGFRAALTLGPENAGRVAELAKADPVAVYRPVGLAGIVKPAETLNGKLLRELG